jgi:hypothetical protein
MGNEKFVRKIQEQLGYRGKGRRIQEGEVGSEIRESVSSYSPLFGGEKSVLSSENAYFFDA